MDQNLSTLGDHKIESEEVLNPLDEISQEISMFKGEELVNFTKRNLIPYHAKD